MASNAARAERPLSKTKICEFSWENGRTKSVKKGSLLAKSTYKDALEGSSHARGQALRFTALAQVKSARDVEKRAELGRQWKGAQQRLLDAALAKGEPTRLILPHPNDIMLDLGTGYQVVGPFDEESLLLVERRIKERDVFLLQAQLEDRLAWDEEPDRDPAIPESLGKGSARLLATMIDSTLPERLRLSDHDWIRADWQSGRKTKRELLKEARRGFRSIGQIVPRGFKTPPIGLMVRLLMAAKPHVRDIFDATKEGDHAGGQMAQQNLSDELQALLHARDRN